MEEQDKEHIFNIKKKIVDVARTVKSGHLPSSFSSVEILYTLYTKVANITKENLKSNTRDVVIVSKEHCKMGQCCVLEEIGLLPKGISYEWQMDDGRVGHDIFREVGSEDVAAIDVSFGSLGMGLGCGIGLAIAQPQRNVYVVVGDGELQEGSCWESLMYIGFNKIKNVVVIVDRNGVQIDDFCKNIIDSSANCTNQIRSFGFDVVECNGHDIDDLEKALKTKTKKPLCVVANTIKGKEAVFVREAHNFCYSHASVYAENEYDKILENLA